MALGVAPDMHAVQLHSPQMLRHVAILWRRGAGRSQAALEFVALFRPAEHLPLAAPNERRMFC